MQEKVRIELSSDSVESIKKLQNDIEQENINIIIANSDNIEMIIGRNYFKERRNFIIGMLITIILLIGIIIVKSFLF